MVAVYGKSQFILMTEDCFLFMCIKFQECVWNDFPNEQQKEREWLLGGLDVEVVEWRSAPGRINYSSLVVKRKRTVNSLVSRGIE